MTKFKRVMALMLAFMLMLGGIPVQALDMEYSDITGMYLGSKYDEVEDTTVIRYKATVDLKDMEERTMGKVKEIRAYAWDENLPFNGVKIRDAAASNGLNTKEEYVNAITYDNNLTAVALQRLVEGLVHKKYEHLRSNMSETGAMFDKDGNFMSAGEILAWASDFNLAFKMWTTDEVEDLIAANGEFNVDNGHLHLLIDPVHKAVGFAYNSLHQVGIFNTSLSENYAEGKEFVGTFDFPVQVRNQDLKVENRTETEEIPFETIVEFDPQLEPGERRETPGEVGEKTLTYETVTIFGTKLEEKLVSEAVTKEPVKHIVYISSEDAEGLEEIVVTKVEIPFMTEEVETTELAVGETNIVQEGVVGEKEVTEKVYYNANKEEIKREVVEEKVIKEPINKIVEVGVGSSEFKLETKEEVIPFATQYIIDDTLEENEEVVVQEGVDGLAEVTYQVEVLNGEILQSKKIDYKITKEPVNKIVRTNFPEGITLEEEETPFEIFYYFNEELENGEIKLVREGVVGKTQYKVQITTDEEGNEVKEILEENVISLPVFAKYEVGADNWITEEEIPFEEIFQEDDTIIEGKEIIKQEGVNGLKELKHSVEFVNGEAIANEVEENIIKEPVDKIILVGTKKGASEDEEVTPVEEIKEEKVVTELPFSREIIRDDKLEKGKEVVDVKGQKGSETKTYNVKYIDGKEVSRELINTEKVEPINEVLRVGTKDVTNTKADTKGNLEKTNPHTGDLGVVPFALTFVGSLGLYTFSRRKNK